MYDFQTLEMDQIITNTGKSVADLSANKPALIIFLRHFGCTFCREAIVDISEQRDSLEKMGVNIIFVHMSDEKTAVEYFDRFGLNGAVHVCDPECDLYQQFGLVKGNLRQLFGLNTWIRGFDIGIMKGLGIGKTIGDGFQMPGVFLVHKGEIQGKFIHKSVSDRPNYEELTRCCIS